MLCDLSELADKPSNKPRQKSSSCDVTLSTQSLLTDNPSDQALYVSIMPCYPVCTGPIHRQALKRRSVRSLSHVILPCLHRAYRHTNPQMRPVKRLPPFCAWSRSTPECSSRVVLISNTDLRAETGLPYAI